MNSLAHSPRITIHMGSVCPDNPGPGGWGAIVCYWHGDTLYERLELSGGRYSTTNNRMELSAALTALAYVTDMAALAGASGITGERGAFDTAAPMVLYSDSEYVVGGFSEPDAGAESPELPRHEREAGENRDLWEELDAIVAVAPITFQRVRGHIGDLQNKAAVAIARAAIPAAP